MLLCGWHAVWSGSMALMIVMYNILMAHGSAGLVGKG